MLNLRELINSHHKSARSYCELVPWMAMVEKDIVLNTDSALLSCAKFNGLDVEGTTDIESDAYVDSLEQALRSLNEKFTLWSIVDRRRLTEYPETDSANPLGNLVDREWRKKIEQTGQFKNSHYLCHMYSLPKSVNSFFDRIKYYMHDGDRSMFGATWYAIKSSLSNRHNNEFEIDNFRPMLADFKESLQGFRDSFGKIGWQVLQGSDLLSFLNRRCNPADEQRTVGIPPTPMYLNTYLPTNSIKRHPNHLEFTNDVTKYVGALTVKSTDLVTYPTLLDCIQKIDGEVTIILAFRFLPKSEARKVIEAAANHFRTTSKNFVAWVKECFTKEESDDDVDEGRLLLADDSRNALTSISAEQQIFGYMNITVLCYGDSKEELENTVKEAKSCIEDARFLTIREKQNLIPAFSMNLPGQWARNPRWLMMTVSNFADLFPLRTISNGRPYNKHLSEQLGRRVPALALLPTEYKTPFFFDFHSGANAHTIVVGPTRSGKSAFMLFLLLMATRIGINILIFDKDYTCKIATLLSGGDHVDASIDAETKISINPLALLSDRTAWPFLIQWFELLFSARGDNLTSKDINQIQTALETMYTMTGGAENQDAAGRRLRDFCSYLPLHLQERLEEWTEGKVRGAYFDNERDTFSLSTFSCIEIGKLLNDSTAAMLFLEYAFYRIERRLQRAVSPVPTLIYLEECWFMFANQKFVARLDNWLRTLQKYNAWLVLTTQSLQELSSSSIFVSIIDNIKTRIFLPNKDAYANELLYKEQFLLNDEQLRQIATATPNKNYYIVKRLEGTSRMVDVVLPPSIIAMVSSDSLSQKIFKEIYQQPNRPASWQVDYIKRRMNARNGGQL